MFYKKYTGRMPVLLPTGRMPMLLFIIFLLFPNTSSGGISLISASAVTGRSPRTSFSISAAKEPPYLEVYYSLKDKNGNKVIDAGEKASLTVIVKNTGEGSANSVSVKLKGPANVLNFFDKTKAYLGSVNPSAQKKIIFTIKAPYEIAKSKTNISIIISESDDFVPVPQTVPLKFAALIPPSLSVKIIGVDDDKTGRSRGNNNKMAEPGERIELMFKVENAGPGPAADVRVSLITKDKGLKPDIHSVNVGSIPSGTAVTDKFVFFIKGTYKKKKLAIAISLKEKTGLFGGVASATLPIMLPGESMTAKEGNIQLKQITKSGFSLETDFISSVKKSYVTSDKFDTSPGASSKPYKIPSGFTLPKRNNAYAVIIGISKYKNNIPRVKYAGNDAEELFSLLTDPAAGAFKKENVKLAVNDVTRTDIEDALEWLRKKAVKKDDTAIFFFSGHGGADENGNTYILPYDTKINSITRYGLSRELLREKLSEIKAGNVVAMLDACYSGSGERSVRDKDAKLLTLIKPLSIVKKDLVIISSSEGQEISKDYRVKKHGVMTYYMLEGLKGAADNNNNGWVDTLELFDYLKPLVRKKSQQLGSLHTPQLIGARDAAGSIRLAMNTKRLIGISQEFRLKKVEVLYNKGLLSPEKFDRASREIESGKESKTLKDFLDGRLSGDRFGKVY